MESVIFEMDLPDQGHALKDPDQQHQIQPPRLIDTTLILPYQPFAIIIVFPVLLIAAATLLLICSTVMRMAVSPCCTPRRLARTFTLLHVIAGLCVAASGGLLLYLRLTVPTPHQKILWVAQHTEVPPFGGTQRFTAAMLFGLAALVGLGMLICSEKYPKDGEEEEVKLVRVKVQPNAELKYDDELLCV